MGLGEGGKEKRENINNIVKHNICEGSICKNIY
jgi:hypothetical protein